MSFFDSYEGCVPQSGGGRLELTQLQEQYEEESRGDLDPFLTPPRNRRLSRRGSSRTIQSLSAPLKQTSQRPLLSELFPGDDMPLISNENRGDMRSTMTTMEGTHYRPSPDPAEPEPESASNWREPFERDNSVGTFKTMERYTSDGSARNDNNTTGDKSDRMPNPKYPTYHSIHSEDGTSRLPEYTNRDSIDSTPRLRHGAVLLRQIFVPSSHANAKMEIPSTEQTESCAHYIPALRVSWDMDHNENILEAQKISDKICKRIQGFRLSANPLRFALREYLANDDSNKFGGRGRRPSIIGGRLSIAQKFIDHATIEEDKQKKDDERHLIQLGFKSLGAYDGLSVDALDKLLFEFESPDETGFCGIDVTRMVLVDMFHRDPNIAQEALTALSKTILGRRIILRLYFGRWWGHRRSFQCFSSMLDPAAFLMNGFGRICLNGVYNFLFGVLTMYTLFDPKITSWQVSDHALACFLAGQIVQEASEFWNEGTYLSSPWNLLDAGVILGCALYFALMRYESVCRVSLGLSFLCITLRLISLARNSSTLGMGRMIRTIIHMLYDLAGFCVMYFFILGSFAACFFTIFHFELGVQREMMGWKSYGQTFRWCYEASLGQFRYEDFFGTPYEGAGILLLSVYMLLCAVIMVNFMIAILSHTFEEQQDKAQLNKYLDMGHDIVNMTYTPALDIPPCGPRPVNLIFLILNAFFGFVKMIASNFVEKKNLIHIEKFHFNIHVVIYWITGNLLFLVALLMMHIMIVIPIFIVFSMMLSPLSFCGFLCAVIKGDLVRSWRDAKRDHHPQTWYEKILLVMSCFTGQQLLILSGPFIICSSGFVYLAFYIISEYSWSTPVFKELTLMEDFMVWSVFDVVQEHHELFVHLIFDNFVVLLFLGFLYEIWWALHSSGHFISPLAEGWSRLLTLAEENFKLRHVYNVVGVHLCGAPGSKQGTCSVMRDKIALSRLKMGRAGLWEYGADIKLKKQKRLENQFEQNEIELPNGNLVKELNYFMGYLVDDPLIPSLLPSAFEALFNNNDIKVRSYKAIAASISLDDWYWFASSLVCCSKNGDHTFTFSDRAKLLHSDGEILFPRQRMRLATHPYLSQFVMIHKKVIYYEKVEGCQIFIEDWIWALYNRALHTSMINVKFLVDFLTVYAEKQFEKETLQGYKKKCTHENDMVDTDSENGTHRQTSARLFHLLPFVPQAPEH